MRHIFFKPMVALAGVLAIGMLSETAHADMASAEALAAPCAGCHGPDGSSLGPAIPAIAGITQDYFMVSMKEYVSGKRPATVMDRIAKGYTEEEFKVLAAYFAGKEIVRYKQDVDPELVAKGEPLFKKYCESCHEEDGYLADGIGVMAGQTKDYLRFMVDDFFSGKREWEKRQAKKMQALMDDHGDEGYEAVIHYMASKM